MQVKRFLAADMRRALEMVRQELGADAVILSSNRTKDGVEILTTQPKPATPADPDQSEGLSSADYPPPTPQGRQRVAAIEEARQRHLAEQHAEASARELLRKTEEYRSVSSEQKASGKASESAADRYGLVDLPEESNEAQASSSGDLGQLQAEMAEMRLLLEEQLTQMLGAQGSSATPIMASVGRRLERMGLPKELSDELLKDSEKRGNLANSWSDALAKLSRQLPVDATDPVNFGGVYALVGPTGAGKTTTIAKLAARYVMEHGPRDVALVTTDSYRIGALDQLRSVGKILRVPVRAVDNNNSLENVLYSLRRCSLVLIDTAGFNHGDERLAEQVEALGQQPQVNQLLALPCNSQPQVLKASVHAYGGDCLQGCIFTKLDESASMGEALGIAMQSELPIVYSTDGQDIAQDIEVAKAHKLVAKAAAFLKQTPPAGDSRGETGSGAQRAAESV